MEIKVKLISMIIEVKIEFRVSIMRRKSIIKNVMVIKVKIGKVMVEEGLINYMGKKGWLRRKLMMFGMVDDKLKIKNNYWGVFE